MNRYTDLSQSKKLAEVWKDAETEKVWVTWEGLNQLFYRIKEEGGGNVLVGDLQGIIYSVAYDEVIPAFQISDILERLPAEIEWKHKIYRPQLRVINMGRWSAEYRNISQSIMKTPQGIVMFDNDNPLTALYNLTIWLHENKYIGEGQNG